MAPDGHQHQRRLEILHVASQAADWLRLLHEPEVTDETRRGFLKWAKESPLHVKEFLIAYTTYRKLDRSEQLSRIDVAELIASMAPNVRPMGPHAVIARAQPSRPRAKRWLPVAAGIAALAVIAAYAWNAPGTYSTDAGEQLRVSLKDGSGVYLNALSRVRTDFTSQARDVYLERGQALFEVEHDPARPFRVHAGRTVIQAIGTQFDVWLQPQKITVAVVEGAVQVSADRVGAGPIATGTPNPHTRLSAGEGTTIGADGLMGEPVRIDTETAASWWQQQLVFERTPLEQVAAQFNRYNRLQLRIEGDAVAQKRFNGVFGSRKPESFLAYLAQDDSLSFERRGTEVIIRAKSAPTARQQP